MNTLTKFYLLVSNISVKSQETRVLIQDIVNNLQENEKETLKLQKEIQFKNKRITDLERTIVDLEEELMLITDELESLRQSTEE